MSFTLEDLKAHPDLYHEVMGKLTAKDCYERHICNGNGALLSDMLGFYKKDNPKYYQDIARGFLSKMDEYVTQGLIVTEQVGEDTGFLPVISECSEVGLSIN